MESKLLVQELQSTHTVSYSSEVKTGHYLTEGCSGQEKFPGSSIATK